MALHHRFVALAHRDARYAESRRICLESAKQALFYQRILANSQSPEAGNPRQSWRLLSLLDHDFLFAALVLAVDVKCNLGGGEATRMLGDFDTEHLSLLQQACGIWQTYAEHSPGAQQAHEIVGKMLNSLVQGRQRASTSALASALAPSDFHEDGDATPTAADTTQVQSFEANMLQQSTFHGQHVGTTTDDSMLGHSNFLNLSSQDSGGHAWNMTDMLLDGAVWPNMDFTTAVGML